MSRIAMQDILEPGESYYTLVLGVAKRARDIAERQEYQRKLSTKKPVKVAIEELYENKYRINTTGTPKELECR